ncbi:MAG TPA: response regulator transcription factor [Acidimicrobiales bacterium]|jgi:two-component system KDP operon response regulator KdpE
MADEPTLLVVEDEVAMTKVLTASMTARGYRVVAARTGEEGLVLAASDPPAVVVLDLGLPDIDGLEVCRRIRGWSEVPIIVLTADGSEQRKVDALDCGADDYVTKPFSMPELLARVRVATRHAARITDPDVLDVGDLHIDVGAHQVTLAGSHLDLTPKQFGFLTLLAKRPGMVVTHRAILEKVWGPRDVHHIEYVRIFAAQLRRKLGEAPGSPRLLTEPGVGYRLVASPPEP